MRIKKVDYNIAKQRFDRYLRKHFKQYPEIKLSDIYSWIRKWMILINNKRAKEDYRLLLWDEIKFNNIEKWEKKPKELAVSKENKIKKMKIEDIKNIIIYEDQNWIVFDKPAGVVAHPWNQHTNDLCMNDYLERYCELIKISKTESTFKPSFGYRLDKDTSGVLISAKNYEALQYLNEIIRNREIDKEYKTIVWWEIPKKLIVEKSIEKIYDKKFGSSRMIVSENGLSAKSEFCNEKTVEHDVLWKISLVDVNIYTGRMHQIRVHLSSQGFPVLWDIIYGNPVLNRKLYKQLKINRQMLHCSKYSFKNLDGKKISFESKLPEDFKKLI